MLLRRKIVSFISKQVLVKHLKIKKKNIDLAYLFVKFATEIFINRYYFNLFDLRILTLNIKSKKHLKVNIYNKLDWLVIRLWCQKYLLKLLLLIYLIKCDYVIMQSIFAHSIFCYYIHNRRNICWLRVPELIIITSTNLA